MNPRKGSWDMILAKTFKELRKESLCLSQVELAKKLEISQSALCKIEKGKLCPTLTTFVRMRRLLLCGWRRHQLDMLLEREV